jgi:hypothetical protein
MTIKMLLATIGAVALLSVSPALAQTPAASPDKPAAAAADKTTAKAKAPRTAKSLECSKQADAKGLHGKERKKFRSECKKS